MIEACTSCRNTNAALPPRAIRREVRVCRRSWKRNLLVASARWSTSNVGSVWHQLNDEAQCALERRLDLARTPSDLPIVFRSPTWNAVARVRLPGRDDLLRRVSKYGAMIVEAPPWFVGPVEPGLLDCRVEAARADHVDAKTSRLACRAAENVIGGLANHRGRAREVRRI